MKLAFCHQCEPAALIGLNIGDGFASHTVGESTHRAKVVEVPHSEDDRQGSSESVGQYLERIAKKYRNAAATGALPIKSYDGPSFEVTGGLGDVLHCLHTTDRYTSLMSLGPKDRRLVVVMSHNPHAVELFKWHPKAAQLDIVYIGYRSPWGPEQRKKLWLPEPILNHSRVPAPLDYYPGPDDREPLAQLGRMKYVAFCLTGSNNNDRDIPLALSEQTADVALKMGFEVVVLGRNYRTIAQHGTCPVSWPHVEPTLQPRKGIVSMVDRLSVPGTCRALAMADAVFCAHSALCLASWYMHRPTFVLYNDQQARLFEYPLGYAFGRDYRENRHMKYTAFELRHYAEWLGRVKNGDYGFGGTR